MKKRWRQTFLVVSTIASLIVPQMTSASSTGTIHIYIDGQDQQYDVSPYIKNNRTLVPLRGIFEALGATVTWTPDQPKLIVATKGDTMITMNIDSNIATINGQAVTLDQPAEVTNDRTFVPLRFVSEVLGADVTWDQQEQEVDILSDIYPVGSSVQHQVLNLALYDEIPTLDPGQATDAMSFDVLEQTSEGLTRLDAKGQATPGIAETWDVSPDGLTWTFHLRSDAKWADGSPVTAHDFEYAWKRVLNPQTQSQYAFLLTNWVQGAEAYHSGKGSADQVQVVATDDQMLRVHLTHPVSYFAEQTAFPTFFPVKQSFVESHPQFGQEADQTLSDGPFKLATWKHDRYAILTQNKNYWDYANVKLNKVKYQMEHNADVQEELYRSGGLDGFIVSAWQYDRYKDAPGFQTLRQPTNGYLEYNEDVPVLQNVKIRKALTYAIDGDGYADAAYQNGATGATGFVPTGVSDGVGGDFRADNGDLLDHKDHVTEAKDLLSQGLKELGYTKFPYLTILLDDATSQMDGGEYIRKQWKNVLGINVMLEYVPYSMHLDLEKNRSFDISLKSWGADYNDPTTFLDLFTSDCDFNDVGYSNPQYDQLLHDADKMNDPNARLQNLMKAEQLLMNDMPIGPVFFRQSWFQMNPDVQQVVWHSYGPKYDLKSAYLTSGK